jgi:hypothetical protein
LNLLDFVEKLIPAKDERAEEGADEDANNDVTCTKVV